MEKINNIITFLEKTAPLNLKESWDNVGLLVGDRNMETEKIVFSMDLTDSAIDMAIKNGAKMIVTHHPLIFKPLHKVNTDTVKGKKIMKCIKHDISVYTAHTNLDSCLSGTSDVLCDLLEVKNKKVANITDESTGAGLGRFGTLSSTMTLETFLVHIKEKGFTNIKYAVDKEGLSKPINKVCVSTGSFYFDGLLAACKENCDVYITGDVKYHDVQEGYDRNIAIIDLGHYKSELPVFQPIMDKITKYFDVDVMLCDINEAEINIF